MQSWQFEGATEGSWVVKIRTENTEGIGLVKQKTGKEVLVQYPHIGEIRHAYHEIIEAESAFTPENVKLLNDLGVHVRVNEKYPDEIQGKGV